ncbi:hypothetical protein MAR_012799 [Mya arenaria]|uniref:Integrase catalytic domain-containing protein n=1 Tax=Mya arenaria TaxID=6604 RepID=A0ABY7FY59_MYAAR|nr:hypothetical protein MAR_012799 [Mya arenaria]
MLQMYNLQYVLGNNTKEPLLQHGLPLGPWQKLGIDLMQYRNRDYVIVVDYFSKFVELRLLNGKKCTNVHGWQQQIVADNMPFNSKHFRTFCEKHSIKLTTASPIYSQSNAHENGQDESIALQEYRNTPITGCEYSPAQMLMSRRLRDKIPTKSDLLKPKVCENAFEQLLKCQKNQKTDL